MSTSTLKSSIEAYPSVNIVGAGIAGLSLACHLRRRRIPFTIFDAASKPKGHSYGITISPWGYTDLLGALEPKLDVRTFREITAVDRLIEGQGITTASPSRSHDDIRVSDMALREVLARGHQVQWNHKVVSAESVAEGLKLKFENGEASTAKITIDAGGERSGLMSLLLPDVRPEILPYAVYHGSRYIPQSEFYDKCRGVFRDGENVRNFPIPTSSQSRSNQPWHLQIAKSHIAKDQLSSRVDQKDTIPDNDHMIEFRYTFSRPARTTTTTNTSPPSSPNSDTTPDPLFNPNRAANEATRTPPSLFAEISTLLSSSSSASSSGPLPPPLTTLLSPPTLQKDRILNWLMRLRPQTLHTVNLHTLASRQVIAIGDAAHSTPPLRSEGASFAMADATSLAGWIEEQCKDGEVSEDKMMRFYEERLPVWQGALDGARMGLEEMHVPSGTGVQDGKLSGRI